MTNPRHRTTFVFSVLAIASVLTTIVHAQTTRPIPAAPPVQVGILALDGVYNSELIAPIDIFHHTVFHTKPGMEVFLVGRETGLVSTFEGQRVQVDYDLASAPPIDVLVVPSAKNNMGSDLEDERLIAWLRTRGQAAKHVLSICDGAFLLAEAGLLDGHRSTTFPGDIAAFRRRYPQLSVVDGVSFVADGPAITGVGGARSYDPALYLVERLFGADVARGVGRGMVIDWDVDRVRHLVMPDPGIATPTCYLPGDRLDAGITLENAAGDRVTLDDAIRAHPRVRAVVLTILAGGEATPTANRGGVWCEDTFAELANLRYLRKAYEHRGVLFVGVTCPPVYHEAQFGFDDGAFLSRPVDDPVYLRNRAAFVKTTEDLVVRDILPFDVVLYDHRFTLLGKVANGEAVPSWHGRFKWFEDTQTYGTPTIWVLADDLAVVGPPFFMNVYESDGGKVRYSANDIRSTLERLLTR